MVSAASDPNSNVDHTSVAVLNGLIDRLATAALRDAARRKKKLVDRDVVTRVAEALLRFD